MVQLPFIFTHRNYREAVLKIISTAPYPTTGLAISQAAGLTYRQTIDALNALHNMSRVTRTGRKFTARWSAVTPIASPTLLLEQAFRGFFK